MVGVEVLACMDLLFFGVEGILEVFGHRYLDVHGLGEQRDVLLIVPVFLVSGFPNYVTEGVLRSGISR